MKNLLSFIIVVLLGSASALVAQERKDVVNADPTHHHVIMENDHVRIFKVLASPGARSPMHSHPPTLVVALGSARFRATMPDGAQGIFEMNPGQVFWIDSAAHSWELLAGQAQAVGVEVKAAAQGVVPAATPLDRRDAVAVDPTHHHVILENDHVRVFEVLAGPGAKSPMHTHPPLVVISFSKARLRMTAPDGSKSIFDLNPGQVLWLENVVHSWDLLSGQVHLFAVEIKAAQKAAGK